MADRSIVVRLRAEVADFKRQLGEASTSVDGVGKKAQESAKKSDTALGQMVVSASRHEDAWKDVGKTLLGIGMAAAAGVGMAVAKYAEFDEAMSHVQAATHETTANMDKLRAASIAAGADTQYSATEAAGAVEELAKAGVSTTAILGGGLTGALDLAAAGTFEVAEAAEIAATAMTMFNLEGEQVPHIADLLAAGAGKAQGSVQDMGMALKQAGLVASQTGLSIEETTGGLAAFASAGLIGSDAGTSFKSMLQRLTPQSKEAQKAMDELGLSAYDGQGEFVGLADFAGRLQSALKDLTPEQRNSTMATIFGSDAVRAAAVLYNQGASGIQEWIGAVDDSGYAAETAALNTDNLRGDVERLGGALDTALIKTGEASNGVLRGMTSALTGVIDAYGEASPEVQTATLVIGGAVAVVGLLSGGFLVMAPRIIATRAAMATLATTMPKTTTAMTGLGKAAGAVGVALTAASLAAAVFNDVDATTITQYTQALLDLDGAAAAMEDAPFVVTNMAEAFERIANPSGIQRFDDWVGGFTKIVGVAGDAADLTEQFHSMGQALSELYASDPDLAARKFEEILEITGGTTDELLDLMPAYRDTLIDVENGAEATAQAQEGMGDATAEASKAVEDQVAALADLIEGQSDLAGIVLSVRDAQRGFEAAIDDATEALKDNGKTLDITTVKGRANQSALDDIADAGWQLIESMQANGATQAELQASMEVSRARFIEAATAMGMSGDEADALANSLRLIPTSVSTAVVVDTARAQSDVAAFRRNVESVALVIQARVNADPSYTPAKSPVAIRRAEGGPVFGPGTSTSDSIPALLSDGEYVIKAAAVNQYGRTFFDGLNAQRFATGGYVGGSSSGSTPSAPSLAGLSIEGTLDLGGGLIGTLRGVVRDEMNAAVRGVRAGVR